MGATLRRHDPRLAAINDEVTDLRDALFTLEHVAQHALRPSQTAIVVALQSAAHQLGEVQRQLARTM